MYTIARETNCCSFVSIKIQIVYDGAADQSDIISLCEILVLKDFSYWTGKRDLDCRRESATEGVGGMENQANQRGTSIHWGLLEQEEQWIILIRILYTY
jgi:hypothetical protein